MNGFDVHFPCFALFSPLQVAPRLAPKKPRNRLCERSTAKLPALQVRATSYYHRPFSSGRENSPLLLSSSQRFGFLNIVQGQFPMDISAGSRCLN